MNINEGGILSIILGVIALIFPLITGMAIGVVSGFLILIIAIWLLVAGVHELKFNPGWGVIVLICAIAVLLLSFDLIFNPSSIGPFVSVISYIIGGILVFFGIMTIISNKGYKPITLIGVTTIIFGFLYIILGYYMNNPVNLGILIGLWLVITGVISLLGEDRKGYIDI